MKNIILILILCLSQQLKSQSQVFNDTIISNDADTIICKIGLVNNFNIFYQFNPKKNKIVSSHIERSKVRYFSMPEKNVTVLEQETYKKEIKKTKDTKSNGLNFSINPYIGKNNTDTILAEYRTKYTYLIKNNQEFQVTWPRSRAIKKKAFIEPFDDVPELHKYAQINLSHYRYGFAKSLISCYNDYIKTGKTKKLNQKYYNTFGMISKKEFRRGPSEEMLKIKKPIKGEIRSFSVTTNHYTNSNLTSSTTGENYRLKFTYGNAEYKSGFLLSNLKKSMVGDKEALKHIKKYRRNWAARTFGPVIAATAIVVVGLKLTEPSPLVFIPAVLVINWMFIFPQKYKTKNITNAINTYNQNLK